MALHRNVRGGKPSPYPRIPFHALRSAQLGGAVIVSGIMAYFIDHLRDEKYPIPWTFIVLLAVSLATIIALSITIIFYNFTYLSPRFNLILNGTIALGWALGMGLLTWSISGSQVLQKSCSTFGAEAAIGVCREYKALWASTFCGTVSTILAFLLDIFISRREARLGAYGKPEDEQDAQRLRDIKKTPYLRGSGYDEVPLEQGDHLTSWQAGYDHTYHNGYGAQQPTGPLDNGDLSGGYRDRL